MRGGFGWKIPPPRKRPERRFSSAQRFRMAKNVISPYFRNSRGARNARFFRQQPAADTGQIQREESRSSPLLRFCISGKNFKIKISTASEIYLYFLTKPQETPFSPRPRLKSTPKKTFCSTGCRNAPIKKRASYLKEIPLTQAQTNIRYAVNTIDKSNDAFYYTPTKIMLSSPFKFQTLWSRKK